MTGVVTGRAMSCWSLNQVAILFITAESDLARHAGHSSTRASRGVGAVGGFNVCPIGIPVNHPSPDARCRRTLRGASVELAKTAGHV